MFCLVSSNARRDAAAGNAQSGCEVEGFMVSISRILLLADRRVAIASNLLASQEI